MILLLWPAAGRAAPAFDAGGDGELVLSGERWSLTLDAATGAIRRIEDRTGSGAILRGGPDLWSIGRHGAVPVVAGDCTFRHGWDGEKAELTLVFDGPEAAVSIVCEVAEEGPVWRSEIAMKRGTMVEWRFPARLEFDAGDVTEFVIPDHLGLAFTGQWFRPGGAGMMAAPMGPEGLLRVTGDRCDMRPVADDPVAVTPGPDADGWLPQWYREEMPRWRVTANRCPRDGKFDLALVGTAHGPWLTGYRLGGSGWLFRLGGMLGRDDARPRTASVVATLAR